MLELKQIKIELSNYVHMDYLVYYCMYMYVGCPECSTKCNVDLKKKLLILFPTMAEKQISGVLAKEDGINLMMISIIILWYFNNDFKLTHTMQRKQLVRSMQLC